jgi:hypothetical protein
LDILSNESLGARGCSPPDIVNGTCGAKSQAVRSTFSSIDKDAPPNLFDVGSPDGRKKIYNLCDKLRAHVTDSMRLATLDALLVRWAATRASLLQEKLANDKDLTQIANDTQRPAADIVDLCWNNVDNQTIKDIETAFGVKFDGPK